MAAPALGAAGGEHDGGRLVTNAAGTKPLTSSVFYVLLALADEERHGVGIGDEVRRRTGGVVELGPGTLYATLARMLDRGLVAMSDRRPEPGDDPRRRYYRITESGREALRRESERLAVVMGAVRDKGVLGRGG